MRLPFFVISAFSDKQFCGNPASILALNEALPNDGFYGKITAEMPTAEAAFFYPQDHKDFTLASVFNLRWFMPEQEIKMCGHATLGAAAVLFKHYQNKSNPLTFKTLYGNILCFFQTQSQQVSMLLQSAPLEKHSLNPDLQALLGITTYSDAAYAPSRQTLIVELPQAEALKEAKPNFWALKNYPHLPLLRVVLTTQVNDKQRIEDFSSRVFCPWINIDEDAVSAATHTLLAAYWAERLKKNQLIAYQASERSGYLQLECQEVPHVLVKGKTQMVLEGHYHLQI